MGIVSRAPGEGGCAASCLALTCASKQAAPGQSSEGGNPAGDDLTAPTKLRQRTRPATRMSVQAGWNVFMSGSLQRADRGLRYFSLDPPPAFTLPAVRPQRQKRAENIDMASRLWLDHSCCGIWPSRSGSSHALASKHTTRARHTHTIAFLTPKPTCMSLSSTGIECGRADRPRALHRNGPHLTISRCLLARRPTGR